MAVQGKRRKTAAKTTRRKTAQGRPGKSRAGKKGTNGRGLATRLRRWCFRLVLAGFLLTVALILALRWVAPPTSMFMVSAQVKALIGSGEEFHYHWVPLECIAPEMALAVIAAEDQQFARHHGFDLSAIRSAVLHNQQGGSIRGGSTISQQLAKNLFLWPGRSYVRKGLEAGLTVLFELLLPKERILELYLNVAQFGDNLYGVGAAAERYFHCAPAALSRHQAALLASSLPNPSVNRPDRPRTALRQRARWVERQMRNLGLGYLAKLN